ncbi:hypothetical protein BV22DRAFT_154411 [Leucogyrophana mollusca]|uniref:Uncharacterized protein n=1 Tax=Leucogyrophana mollusca TaxID=85980 RepID=A0ACB8BW60_9AGAM|nr:hypothetical protein BV22DRAFT_154411 [Leucogyrophana mollusca]
MVDALAAAPAKLDGDQRRLEEGRDLDRQLEEYEQLLRLVEGPCGSFAQVAEDWTKVQREIIECRKDLGWTEHCQQVENHCLVEGNIYIIGTLAPTSVSLDI